MADFRFLHAADIHLDSPLRGLERYEDAPVDAIRGAANSAFENLIELAIAQTVSFVLLAGDLYDGDWKDFRTGRFFVQQMRRLEEVGIPVFLVSGNHDAKSRITKKLTLPPNVTHFSSRRCESKTLDALELEGGESLEVTVHGQSFANRSVVEDLSVGYPPAEPNRFNIGLLHTSLDGRPGHDNYAPCSEEGLRLKGYDYWALGHVHKREIVSEDPWIVFPGNTQGRHAREVGPKGCSIVTVEANRIVAVEHHTLDVVRWAVVDVDLSSVRTGGEAIEAVSENLRLASEACESRLLAARVRLVGATDAHEALVADPDRWMTEIRDLAGALGEGGVWVEKIEFETRRLRDLEAELERTDALGDLLRLVSDLSENAPDLEVFSGSFEDLKKKLPVDLSQGDEPFDPTQTDYLRSRLPAVSDLLLTRLLGRGVDAEGGSDSRDERVGRAGERG